MSNVCNQSHYVGSKGILVGNRMQFSIDYVDESKLHVTPSCDLHLN